jgi:cleavage and polyadenylation specificity factor subunit 1
MTRAFKDAKERLSSATLLAHPHPLADLALCTDASDVGVGACLEQMTSKGWQPLAFFSRQLEPREQKYSAFDKELLAIYLAIRHFRYMLEGRSFTVFMDHHSLTHAMFKQSDCWLARQQRHLAYISEYTTDIRHIAGKHNVSADCLSRVHVDGVWMGVDYNALAAAQKTSEEIQVFRSAATSLRLEDIPFGNDSILCDVSGNHPRPVVPPGFRPRIFHLAHGLAHPGARATRKMLCDRFVWHGMNKDITRWCRECVSCQASKIQRHFKAPVQAMSISPLRFTQVHVDIVGPLPSSGGFTYLLTAIDRTTRWPEAFPLADITASSCANAFLLGWVARFGVPLEITSDRGRQFTSALWTAMAHSLGSQVHRTTAYHPQSNGIVERFHRSLKASLRARLQTTSWLQELPWVLLGHRAAVKEDIGFSPAEMVFGEALLLPGQFVDQGAMTSPPPFFPSADLQPSHHVATNKNATTSAEMTALSRSSHVFVRTGPSHPSLQRPYQGPFRVLEPGAKTFKLLIGDTPQYISVDRLKPATTTASVPAPVVTTRCGRAIRTPLRYQ